MQQDVPNAIFVDDYSHCKSSSRSNGDSDEKNRSLYVMSWMIPYHYGLLDPKPVG